MTVGVTFTMGPKEGYFFNSPTHWARRNLPTDVEALFTKQPPIKDVLELVLGEKDAYFVSYRDADDQVYCRHYNLPNPLITYLYQSHPRIVRDLPTLSITLGPYESYYASDKTSASWSNVPSALEKAFLHRVASQDAMRTVWKEDGREAPSFVSLGADSSYFMRTVGGGGSWNLKSKEEGMVGINKYLEGSADFTAVAGLYLFPNYPASYVMLLTTGKAFPNLPEHTWADYNKMEPALSRAFAPPRPVSVPQASPFQQPQAQPSRSQQSQPQPQSLPIQPCPACPSPGCCPNHAANPGQNCCQPQSMLRLSSHLYFPVNQPQTHHTMYYRGQPVHYPGTTPASQHIHPHVHPHPNPHPH